MICKDCPTMEKCTKSKSCQKTVTRHIWNEYIELAENARHTPKYKELYKKRKEKIERVFADTKEKYAIRYTPYRGLTAVRNWVRLKFATMNLKKFAIHKDMERKRKERSLDFAFSFLNYFNLIFESKYPPA